jgi:hypothetical protein
VKAGCVPDSGQEEPHGPESWATHSIDWQFEAVSFLVVTTSDYPFDQCLDMNLLGDVPGMTLNSTHRFGLTKPKYVAACLPIRVRRKSVYRWRFPEEPTCV